MIMNRLINVRSSIGTLCIVSAFILKFAANSRTETNVDLNIPQPSQQVILLTEPIAQLVSNKTDRLKLAIFNKEFAKRISSYDTDLQQLNDVYVLAAVYSFNDSMKDKYDNLDTKLVELIKSITTDDNHKLTNEEKQKISEYFLGLSWLLINN